MDEGIEDILDDALTDFEALSVSSTAPAVAPTSAASKPATNPPTTSGRSSADAGPSGSAPSSFSANKKPLAFDPLRGGPKRSSASANSKAVSASRDNASNGQKTGAGDPGGGFGDLAEILGGAAGGGMPGLAPELEQLAAQLSRLVAEVGEGGLDGPTPASSSTPSSDPPLSSTVRALAERTQHSMEQQPGLPGLPPLPPGLDPTGGGGFGPGLNSLLPDLRGLEGAGLNQLVDSILQHLLSKDVLYEPIKEIGACYPPWLEKNRDSVPPDEFERFEKQYSYIQQICHVYENDPNNFSELVQLMQQMQACGDPPEEVATQMSAGIMGAHDSSEGGDARDPSAAGVPSVEELQQELNKCPVQ